MPILPLLAWILVCVGIRVAAGVIARERERNTLTSLIMTPIPPKEIISEKWLGCLYAQAGGFLWLVMLGVPAVLTGMYPWWAFVGLMILACSFQCVVASVGVLASVTGQTVEKANQSAVWRGLLGTAVQALVAALFACLALAELFPEGKYFALASFPFGSLIALAFVRSMSNRGNSVLVSRGTRGGRSHGTDFPDCLSTGRAEVRAAFRRKGFWTRSGRPCNNRDVSWRELRIR